MSELAAGLVRRHTGLWQSDRGYRLSWMLWPQLTSLLCAGWVLINPPHSREPAVPWAKPVNFSAMGAQYDALRDQAETDPAAVDRLRRVADTGDAMAEFSMATLYDPEFHIGKVTAPDIKTALDWYEKAAEHGHPVAQANLGVKYYEGRVVPADYAKAIFWLTKAAGRNNRVAERFMGLANESGRGGPVKKDLRARMVQTRR